MTFENILTTPNPANAYLIVCGIKKQFKDNVNYPTVKVTTCNLIGSAFNWSRTSEGGTFWFNLDKDYQYFLGRIKDDI